MAVIPGTTGPDVKDGTPDADLITLDLGDDVGNGLGGNDTVDGGGGSDGLFGGDGDDLLFAGPAGDGGKDTLYGGSGNDELRAGPGDFGDLADGGIGIDHIVLTYFSFIVPGTAFFVTLTPSFFVLAGGAQGINVQNVERITITTADGDDFLQGGIYDDVLDARDGNDTLIGRGGNDQLFAGTGDYDVDGGAGVDLLAFDLSGRSTDMILVLGPTGDADIAGIGDADGIEQLVAVTGAGDDVLTGYNLADTLNGWDGNDQVTGGNGNDSLTGYSGRDTVYGGTGNDNIDTGNQDDRAYGGTGNDRITEAPVALSGNDRFWGEDGHDTLRAGLGNDTVYGGNGNDFIELDGGSDQGFGGAGNDFLRDDLYSPYGDDLLGGGDGNDTVVTGAGIDTVIGGAGNDVIYGGEEVNGGADVDILNTSGSNIEARVIVAGITAGTFTMTHDGIVGITAVKVEKFWIFGGQLGDSLAGGAGNDTIQGNAGYNYANPQPTLDTDTIKGLGGHDRITGGWGQDLLYGGTGRDTFVFVKIDDFGATTPTADRIMDFEQSLDTIDLIAIDADPTTAAVNDAFTLVAAFTNAAGQAVLSAVSATRTLLLLDQTGDGTADMVIDIRGAGGPLAGDIDL